MSEATAIVALVLLALAVLCALLLLWRRPAGAGAGAMSASTIHSDAAAARIFSSAAHQSRECPRETIAHIFGSIDLDFIRSRGSLPLSRAFERDRRQIALHWVWGAFDETRHIMSHHFRAVRSSPDLSISSEAKLVAEFLLHQSLCLALIGALRLAGPDRLGRMASAVSNIRLQVAAAIESFPVAAPGDLTKNSGSQSNS